MSLRPLSLLLLASAFVFGCGGGTKESDEPQTAKEKQLQEARAKGEDDGGDTKHWGKWRYKGDREQCYFIVGSKCFKTENAACQTLRCKKPQKCHSAGAAPATVTCK